MRDPLDVVVKGINPQPWTVGVLGIAWSKGAQRHPYPTLTKSGQLDIYQKALMDAVYAKLPPGFVQYDEPLAVHFLFWRQLESWVNEKGKMSRSMTADATNLQKAAEDAIQKVVYKNDQSNVRVQTDIVEQTNFTTPLIVIKVRPFARDPEDLTTIREAWEARA